MGFLEAPRSPGPRALFRLRRSAGWAPCGDASTGQCNPSPVSSAAEDALRTLLLALALTACGNPPLAPTCDQRADALRTRMAPLVEASAQIDPWARPTATLSPVTPPRLATLDLAYNPTKAERQVQLDGAGRRYVGTSEVMPGRKALCAALAAAPASDHPERVRVLVDASASATLAFELLVDLHSCEAWRPDLVFARTTPPTATRSPATGPPPVRVLLPDGASSPPELRAIAGAMQGGACPVDLSPALAAPGEEQPAVVADALVAGHRACGCQLEDEQVVSVWQAAYLPEVFLTALPIRTSPSALAFQVEADEPWQDAATRLLRYLGPTPLAQPSLLWFGNAGSLAPAEDRELPLPP